MRVAIDARMYDESGIGRYIKNLISKLQVLDQKNEYFILHLGKDNLVYDNNFHAVRADFRWYGISEQIGLLKLLGPLRLNLVHFPHFNAPIFYRGRFVVTIHDLIHQHFSMQRSTTHGPLIYKLKQLGYEKIFKHAIEKSCKILTPSHFVGGQLEKDWHVSSEKIVVTHEAVDDELFKIKTIKKIDFPYIFYVGNAHPHKNVESLIKAFLILKKRHNIKLVLAGNDHYFWQRIKKEYQSPDIIFAGFISDEELASYYKNARCFVMPSFEEGFGIPLLEAFAGSCPVVSSNAGSLPEVGGNAALYFDPKNPEDMAEKISQILRNEKLRQQLIHKGLKRYKEFSWKNLARKTLEVYENCAGA